MRHHYRPSILHRIVNNLKILWNLWCQTQKTIFLPSNTVVIILDVITPYESLWSKQKENALRTLLRRVRMNEHPVVFTRWCRTRHGPLDAIGLKKNVHWSYLIPENYIDSDGKSAFIHADLIEPQDTVVDTVYTNLFAHPVEVAPPHAPVLICGMWTESCVLATARAAAEQNREVFVYAPACAGHLQWFPLWNIQSLYGEVLHRCP